MSEILIWLLITLASFGGGAWFGTSQQKKKCDKEVIQRLTVANTIQAEMSNKIDSLQKLPAKVDTVIETVKIIEYKTDTLILIAKETFLNTDSIKKDVRYLKEVVTP